jgi:signal transduction histidine kinase/CheY-like chemotaxis protein/HAMP domain-containing protein
MVDQLSSFASEVTRVAREVGTEGRLGGQARVEGVSGTWKDLTDSVNSMASNLTGQVRNIADVTTAVATGDLSKKITVDVKGEILELKNTINTMVDQLSSFAAEVTRVAREVGTEGELGGQATVPGVSGTWKDLTDSVNSMAGNLTGQVRGIAKVVTAVANGDLQQKLTVDAKGEIAALADTINSMIDTLATFADQVTSVAREVGVEGKLGGQAKVPGAAGTWKDLTENVNQLAANLTTQVRAIAEVATAVTQGDLTRSITVRAQGEVAALKDTINEMISNLRDTTQKNTEQNWLKTNLAKFSRMLQGQKDLNTVGRLILSELAPVVSAQQALFYVLDSGKEPPSLTLLASYAATGHQNTRKHLDMGEGLIGQCAVEAKKIFLENLPGDYLQISSGLGAAAPRSILVLPIVFEDKIRGVLELASLESFDSTHQAFLDQLTESIGIVINTIEANMRTENLLKQSQSLAHELQSRQEELQQTNEELQEKAQLLAHQNEEVERKNQEVEQARQALEDKAKQLALTSKYKSEFLANMSHELRTPLNSLLILSDQLRKNPEGNLSPRQVEFSKTIHSSGNDLLTLINDILDLSKIESGTVAVEVGELPLEDLDLYVHRTFHHVAESKNLEFVIDLDPDLPRTVSTDAKRLQQILKNLLSNAFKFTHKGSVTLAIAPVEHGWSRDNDDLNRADGVLAFSVTDTGIGISQDKQRIIFEAFQQADGSTSRKYGGTGLGLAISRELARLLHGEIALVSRPGEGSTFTLYIPRSHTRGRGRRQLSEGSAATIQSDNVVASRMQINSLRRLGPAPQGLDLERFVVSREEPEPTLLVNEAGDDRDSIRAGDDVLLIVENDLQFARILLDAAREKGFKGLVTSRGTAALALVKDFNPAAITLDIVLADLDGWGVLERLKNDVSCRHIPVCIISTEEDSQRAARLGAYSLISKPIASKDMLEALLDDLKRFVGNARKRVLLVEDAAVNEPVYDLLCADRGLEITCVASDEMASDNLRRGGFDCVVLNAAHQESCSTLLAEVERLESREPRRVIVYGRKGTGSPNPVNTRLRHVHAVDRLVDQISLCLHRPFPVLPELHRQYLRDIYQSNKPLVGKKALIVDDDIRNIYALSSVLEDYGMNVVAADNGLSAIGLLRSEPDIDIVLMDIMMPDMDGIDTMREVRKLPSSKGLPIIAVTAKAMKGDRERCIEAGAWDYLSKPVDTEQLLSVMRAWVCR